MGRGAAYADFDGDGDLDIVVTTLAGPAYLFRNDGGDNNWLPHTRGRVVVESQWARSSGSGTTVSGTQWQMVHSGSSYASQSELVLTFGLGVDIRVQTLEIEWPSGTVQTIEDLDPNQLVTIDEEQGIRQR